MVVRLFNFPIFWKVQKQKIVTRASTHAEYYALADCVSELLPIKNFLAELNLNVDSPSPIIYEDNSGALCLGKNGKFSKNSKHIDISVHFVSDFVKKGIVALQKVDSSENSADLLTKALGSNKHIRFRTDLRII